MEIGQTWLASMSDDDKNRQKNKMVDLGGDELHRLVRWEYPTGKAPPLTPGLIVSLLKSSFQPPFWDDLDKLASECDAVLADHGLPKAMELTQGADGQWRFQEQQIEPLTNCWYAAEIGRLCWHVSQDRAANHELQLHRIMRIGIELNDWRWREKYRDHTVRGIGTVKSAREGANKRRDAYGPQRQAVLAEMKRLVEQGHSIRRAADLTAQRGIGKSANANRAMWYRHIRANS